MIQILYRYWPAIMLAIALFLASTMTLFTPTQAFAFGSTEFVHPFDYPRTNAKRTKPQVRAHRKRRKRRRTTPPVQTEWIEPEDLDDLPTRYEPEVCLKVQRGRGTQWRTADGARKAAEKDWMEGVRYDFGEKFMDLTNAKSFRFSCVRSSVGELKLSVGKIDLVDEVLYRCEVRARPCRPAMDQLEGRR